MATARPPIITLRGHLTVKGLETELARVEPKLGVTPIGLVVDASQMTGYDDDARLRFVTWNAQHRSQIRRVAIVSGRTLWRIVIAAMSLAAKQEMSAFPERSLAEAWAAAGEQPAISLHVHTGRLAELRIDTLTLTDVPTLIQLIGDYRQRFASQGIVTIADMRAFQTTSQLIFDRCLAMLQRNNPGVVRIAVLVPSRDPLAATQIARALREAGNPNRQAFSDTAAAQAWLGQVLTEAEKTRLAAFLDEAVPPDSA